MITRIPRPLLRYDATTIMRPGTTADADGDPSGNRTVVGTPRGSWQELSPQEQLLAAQRGQTLHAEIAYPLGTDVLAGDFITVRGNTYQVAAVDDLRSFRRCSLRTREE